MSESARTVLFVLGVLVASLGAAMLAPAVADLQDDSEAAHAFFGSALAAMAVVLLLARVPFEATVNRAPGSLFQTDADGWTIRTADGSTSAHYEHMIAVRKGEPEVLSTFAFIEEVIEPPYRKAPAHG